MSFHACFLYPFRKRVVKRYQKVIENSKEAESKLTEEYRFLCYLIDEFHKGHLLIHEQRILLLPLISKLYEIGAYERFHQILLKLNHLDAELNYKIYRSLDCMNSYDFTGMRVWLKRTEENKQQIPEIKKVQILTNLIAANFSLGLTEEIAPIITQMENAVYKKNLLIPEALECLILEYEQNIDNDNLIKLIQFIELYPYSNWKEYLKTINILYRHYQRTKKLDKQQELVGIVIKQTQIFSLTEIERLLFDIDLVRLYMESQIGQWETHSEYLNNNRKRYLYHSEEIAFTYASEFLNTIKNGGILYGRYLKEKYLNEILKEILTALEPYIKEIDNKLAKIADDFLYLKRSLLQRKILFTRLSCEYLKKEPLQFSIKIGAIQKQILALCKKAGNNPEHLHWLLCFTDDTMALSPVLNVKEDIRRMTNDLKQIVEGYNYNLGIAYYLIHLANIFDFLDERENAYNTLKLYNDTGDNPHIYSLAVQTIYCKLEAKYQTRPLEPDLKMHILTREIAAMNQNREIKEAIIIIDEKIEQLHLDGIYIPSGINRERIIEFLYQCGLVYLNGNRFNDVIKISNLFKKYTIGWRVPNSIRIDMSLNHSRALLRKGEIDNADTILIPLLKEKGVPNSIYFEILLLKGQIEARRDWPKFKINSLTKALGLAEASGDLFNIAKVYHEMASMFNSQFPALGLSMLTKAAIIYQQQGNEEQLRSIQLLRAQSCLNLYLANSPNYYGNKELFLNEAKLIISNISKWTLVNDSDKAFYDRINGIVNNNVDNLWKALWVYQGMYAKEEAFRVAEAIYIVAAKNGEKEEAIKGANEYLRMATEENDIQRITAINNNIEGIKQGFIPDFFIPSFPKEPITLLHILDEIAFEEELWGVDKSPIRGYFPYPNDEGKCTPFTNKDGTVSLNPVCLIPFRYYRGQSSRFTPCKPSLLRSHMTPSKQYLERVRYAEFHLLIDRHPITEKYINSFILDFPDGNKPVHYSIYHLALAQHYGIATELIDITADKWVAAFFAATDYENGEYKIHTDTEKLGVFYIYQEALGEKRLEDPRIKPIGIQPFSRPGEQCGYAYPMVQGEDFESKVKPIPFVHDADINELIFNFTNRSHKLFPKEVLKEKADEIKKSYSFSEEAYRKAKQIYYTTTAQEKIDEWEKNENMKYQMHPVTSFTEANMKEFHDTYPTFEEKLNSSICRKINLCTTPEGIRVIHAIPK